MRSIDSLMGCRKICTVSCNYQKAHRVGFFSEAVYKTEWRFVVVQLELRLMFRQEVLKMSQIPGLYLSVNAVHATATQH